MIKRLKLRAALSLLLVLFSMPSAWAEKQYISGTSGPMWEYDSSTRTLTISGEGDMPDFTATNKAPWYKYQHTKIVVESGITSIGDYSFVQYASTLSSGVTTTYVTSVTLPEGITKIGKDAFSLLNVLETINIPASVTSIGERAFLFCDKLTSLVLPSGLLTIGDEAFRLSGPTSISVDPNNTKYDSRNDCNAIIETASNTLIYGFMNTIIPNTVTTIGSKAFQFSGIESVTIPGNVQSIRDDAFASCEALKTVVIENGVKVIGEGVFSYCYDLQSVTIPNSVETIRAHAFYNCI